MGKVEVHCESIPRQASQQIQDVREVFWRRDSGWNSSTLDCWTLLAVGLNSETDICLTCSDPLWNANMSPRCEVLLHSSGLEKGYINSCGSRCAGSRHLLCNGPLMAAMADRQPRALPPVTLRNLLLPSRSCLIQDVKMSEDYFWVWLCNERN